MAKKFIGHLPDHDPLHGYLQYDIQPQISGASNRVKYRVYQMLASNDVYMYEDKFSGTRVVGKFFRTAKEQNIEKAAHRLTNEFHNRTAIDSCVDFNEDCAYMDRLINMLLVMNAISRDEAREFYGLRDQWRHKSGMWEDRQVMVHGDATPENFLFGGGLHVVAFDLERAKHADRVFDTGRIAGELKHFFLRATGNPYAAEPFIGHFLWEYACHFPDRDRAFNAITNRVPFYSGITLLRISRNGWINPEYRRELISEAKNTLRGV